MLEDSSIDSAFLLQLMIDSVEDEIKLLDECNRSGVPVVLDVSTMEHVLEWLKWIAQNKDSSEWFRPGVG